MADPTLVRVASSTDVELAVHDHGGGGRPVLVCHATGFHGRVYDPIVDALGPAFRCVAIDFRGHGDSTEPSTGDMNWLGMADDIGCVVEALDLGPDMAAVGHSMGGAAIVLAELARPGTFAHAWLFEPILIPDAAENHDRPSFLVDSARKRREVFASRDAAFERYASRPPFDRVDPAALRAYVDFGFADQADGTVILKCRGETEARTFEASNTGIESQLGSIKTITTVLGSGDGGMPAQLAPFVAERLAHGTFVACEELTHFGPMEDPAAMAKSIAATFP